MQTKKKEKIHNRWGSYMVLPPLYMPLCELHARVGDKKAATERDAISLLSPSVVTLFLFLCFRTPCMHWYAGGQVQVLTNRRHPDQAVCLHQLRSRQHKF